jgi:hypothetical protein
MTVEEAGKRYLLAHWRLLASESNDMDSRREYEDAGDFLLAAFAEGMPLPLAAIAYKAYCSALVRSAKNVKIVRTYWSRLSVAGEF